jgi:hypothetical protein
MNQELLKTLVVYNSDTGLFFYKPRSVDMFKDERDAKTFNTRWANKQIGTVDGKGYLHFNYKKKFYLLHRMAWLYVYGELPKIVDHINRNKTDNRITNLRNTTLRGNNLNRSANKTGRKTSKYKGVSRHTHGKWQAQTKVNGKTKPLGVFDDELSAYAAYVSFMKKTYGEEFSE